MNIFTIINNTISVSIKLVLVLSKNAYPELNRRTFMHISKQQ